MERLLDTKTALAMATAFKRLLQESNKENEMSLPTCPKCGSQLDVKLTFASGPKSSNGSNSDKVPIETFQELIDSVSENGLSGANREFFTRQKERMDDAKKKHWKDVFLSEKQEKWLRD